MSAIGCNGLSLALGGRSVLRDVSFEIPEGAFVGMLGPNGAGKTTLMRAVLGLLPPQAGSIRVLGGPAARGNPAIGYMPQHRAAAGSLALTGWDSVACVAGGHRPGLPVPDRAVRREVSWALAMVGAEHLARRRLGEMSGGERQRLLLAQTLVGHPRLLLLDEPLISLDPSRQHEVVALVRTLQRELDLTVVFSAHELNPLLGALDLVLCLGGGQAMLGTVDEVITGPALTRLYGTPIEVMRVGARIFVMSGEVELTAAAHVHDDEAEAEGHPHVHS
jgi:zinc/manganese transport system ATP-binding protein